MRCRDLEKGDGEIDKWMNRLNWNKRDAQLTAGHLDFIILTGVLPRSRHLTMVWEVFIQQDWQLGGHAYCQVTFYFYLFPGWKKGVKFDWNRKLTSFLKTAFGMALRKQSPHWVNWESSGPTILKCNSRFDLLTTSRGYDWKSLNQYKKVSRNPESRNRAWVSQQ